MSASRNDVLHMVNGLKTVMGSIERARKSDEASTLALLQSVAQHGSVRPTDIAVELGVHPSTITRQVRVLEANGQCQVAVDPEDRRSCFLTLTDAGQQEVERLTEVGLTRFSTFVADWDADEVRTLGRLLWKLERSKASASRLAPRSKASVARPKPRPNGKAWQKKVNR